MGGSSPTQNESSVLIHAPYGRDSKLILEILLCAGMYSEDCPTMADLCASIAAGAGAAIIADEALHAAEIKGLASILQSQPSWSDFPLIVLTSGGGPPEPSHQLVRWLEPIGTVTLLERPIRRVTLISAVQTALRGRKRQYQIRAQIEEQEGYARALRESENQFRQMADGMPQLIWVARPDGYHEYFNRGWYEYTGLTLEQTKGEGWHLVLHSDDQAHTRETWQRSLATGEPYEMECRCRRRDGEYRWFLSRAVPLRDEQGRIVRWFGTCTDINERKRDADALRVANRELEEFAYVSSHDLQEPLRMVHSFTELLVKRFSDVQDEQARELSHYIQEGVRRMENLIKDLLSYSRIIHPEDIPDDESTDLERALRRALEVFQERVAESGAVVSHDKLPVVRGDENQLVQVFQNLISNSLKYTRPDVPPRIDVTVKRHMNEWIISFQDNGIGFGQQHAERIFGLFKRLHRDEYPGTGLGLAICKRVVERFGGRIWAESQAGAGATFKIALQDAKPRDLKKLA